MFIILNTKIKKDFVEVVKIQEDKMYRVIGFPAKIATVLSGILMLVLRPDLLQGDGWMHAKLFFCSFTNGILILFRIF